jgi:hypothetical protein
VKYDVASKEDANSNDGGTGMFFVGPKPRILSKSHVIPCLFSVMEAVLRKCDIVNLSRFQLPRKIPEAHSYVVPKLVMMGAQVCSLSEQNQEFYQISVG